MEIYVIIFLTENGVPKYEFYISIACLGDEEQLYFFFFLMNVIVRIESIFVQFNYTRKESIFNIFIPFHLDVA